jgi:hypothetical protein
MLEEQLKSEFLAFFNERIWGLLPRECRHIKPEVNVRLDARDGRAVYHIDSNLIIGEAGRRSEKADLPDKKLMKQEFGLFYRSRADRISSLQVCIETPRYIFTYP